MGISICSGCAFIGSKWFINTVRYILYNSSVSCPLALGCWMSKHKFWDFFVVGKPYACILYGVVRMGTVASQITSLAIVYASVYSGADQRKHQSSASLAFMRGIHRGPVNSLTNGQLRGKVSIWWRHHDTVHNQGRCSRWVQLDTGHSGKLNTCIIIDR